jgi:hypothetical protein
MADDLSCACADQLLRGSSKQQHLQDYGRFLASGTAERTAMLSKTSASPVGGNRDPLLHIHWNEAAFVAARGVPGVHTDTEGNADPRTVEHMEKVTTAWSCRSVACASKCRGDIPVQHPILVKYPIVVQHPNTASGARWLLWPSGSGR